MCRTEADKAHALTLTTSTEFLELDEQQRRANSWFTELTASVTTDQQDPLLPLCKENRLWLQRESVATVGTRLGEGGAG